VKEEALVQSILYTKLKGKAMQDFETCEIQTYEELKRQLETCYLTKQSMTHLQIDFNSLKQKRMKQHTLRATRRSARHEIIRIN